MRSPLRTILLVVLATAVSFTSPVMVALLVGWALGARVGRVHWLAIVFGFVGALMVIRPGVGAANRCLFFVVGNAACSAGYQVLTRDALAPAHRARPSRRRPERPTVPASRDAIPHDRIPVHHTREGFRPHRKEGSMKQAALRSIRTVARMVLPESIRTKRASRWRVRTARRVLLHTILREWGYWQSLRANAPVDKDGSPLPWYTYPAIHYLDSLDFSNDAVLEWGAGLSTIYWGTRAKSVLSIEHDPAWATRITTRVKDLPVEMVLTQQRELYVNAPLENRHPQFGLIVVDGIYRPACARVAVEKLARGGILLFDNSNWFPHACSWLRSQGLIQIDFHGLCPMTWVGSATSIFLTRDFVPAPRGGTLPGRVPASLQRSYDRHPLFGDPDGPEGSREHDDTSDRPRA